MSPEAKDDSYSETRLVDTIDRGDGVLINVELASFRGVADGVFVEIREGSATTSVYYTVADTKLLGEGDVERGARILAYTYALEYDRSEDLLTDGKLLQGQIEELKIQNRTSGKNTAE